MKRNVTYTEADLKRLNNELDKCKDLGNVKFYKIDELDDTAKKLELSIKSLQ